MEPLTAQELLWRKDALTIEEAAILLAGEGQSSALQVAKSELTNAVYAGKLRSFYGYLTSTQPYTRLKYIRMKDFKAYFKSIRAEVDKAAAAPAKAEKAVPTSQQQINANQHDQLNLPVPALGTPSDQIPTTNWILKVQAEAAQHWKRLKVLNCNPTRNNIKGDLAKWCRDNNVKTSSGIFPSDEYIYRHAIRSAIWEPPPD